MNNLVANFNQVMEFARRYGVPVGKKRGVLREFLQVRFISELYRQRGSERLVFIGGTSLRLLRNLPRFSEDLDFDNHGLEQEEIERLVERVAERFEFEGIEVELKKVVRERRSYFELRFPKILFDLKITTNPREKLKVKVDYNNVWRLKTEGVWLNRYGYLARVRTNTWRGMLLEKLMAYVERKEVQPRDMYDVVWLFGQRPKLFRKPDEELQKVMKKVMVRWKKMGVTEAMKRRLRPFLFDEREVEKLEWFGEVVKYYDKF